MIEQRRTTADDLGATVAVGFAGAAKSYGAVRAVEGLDLVVRCGETVALLGPNGAGKSTSIGMLLGLVAPDAGAVRVFGETPEVAVRSGRIGAMLQEAGLPKDVKVGELVAFVRRLYPNPLPVQEIMATAGLADLAGRRATSSPAGRRSACGSPVPSRGIPTCSSSTSPPQRWT
jgi:ABC-2 type transport system ATP-binding protein